jgi:hypothetical protein
MHDESMVVSRGSIARGMQLPVLIEENSLSEPGFSKKEASRE